MGEERFTIRSDEADLACVLHLPEGSSRWPCIVAAHGLLSTKDSEKYLLLAEALTKEGYALCRFDFRGCGESGGRLDETTVEGRVRDLRAVVRHVIRHPLVSGRVGLLGSSLGGFVSVFVATTEMRARATALWATPSSLRDLMGREESLREHGLGDAFVRELKGGRFLEAPPGMRYGLIVHGDRDEVVPVAEARALWGRAFNPRRLEIVEGADHRFTDADHRRRAIALSLDWFRKYI